jgi:hypothetical protein
MKKCPLCYKEVVNSKCNRCDSELSDAEMTQLKADTYDSIIEHLHKALSEDDRRREKARCKIALRNIKGWAKDNLPTKKLKIAD